MDKEYHQFLGICFVTAGAILCLVSFFNIKYDASNIFLPKFFYQELAGQLKQGKYLRGLLKNSDDRVLKESMLEIFDKPDVVAVGSSVIMELHGDALNNFKNKKFLNLWLTFAGVEDLWGILGCYLYNQKALPQTMIMDISPWYFDVNPHKSWQSLGRYIDFLDHTVTVQQPPSLWRNMRLAWSYAKAKVDLNGVYTVLKSLNPKITSYNLAHWKEAKENHSYVAFDKSFIPPEDVLYHPDGSTTPSPTIFVPVRNDAEILYSKEPRIDFNQVKRLETLLEYLIREGVQLYIYLPPSNPARYAKMTILKEKSAVIRIESIVKNFAKTHHIPVIGSYDPGVLGWQRNDFYDEHHPHLDPLRKLFQENF